MANKMADKKKNASRGEMVEPKASAGESKSARSAAMREREERRVREQRTAKRESKGPGLLARLRRRRLINFLFEAYQELRYKVTWPTFEEARNMTIVVILLSAAVSAVLGLADLGLTRLFLLISGK